MASFYCGAVGTSVVTSLVHCHCLPYVDLDAGGIEGESWLVNLVREAGVYQTIFIANGDSIIGSLIVTYRETGTWHVVYARGVEVKRIDMLMEKEREKEVHGQSEGCD